MPESSLRPVGALTKATPASIRIGALTIAEEPNLAMASIAARRGRAEEVAAKGGALIGGAWPDIEQQAGAGPIRAFWTGPEQWMLSAPHESHENLAAIAKAAFGDAASITEQNDAWTAFAIAGDDVDAMLERLCAVDLQRAPAQAAIRTVFDHIGGFLLRHGPDGTVMILGPRSSADSLHHTLIAAARSVTQIRASCGEVESLRSTKDAR